MSVREGSVLPPWWLLLRDIGLFTLGAGIAVWEIGWQEPIRDAVLLFAGGLLGGPLGVLAVQTGADALRSRGGTSGPSSSAPADPPSSSVSA